MKQNATLDSSFWINAHRSGLLGHILDLYDIRYAPEVGAELREDYPSGREFWRQVRAGSVNEETPATTRIQEFGPGERAAINLALDNPEWLLLIDDRRPFLAAQRLGIRTVCTPVVLVHLVQTEKLDRESGLLILARLSAMQTVSPRFIEASLAALTDEYTSKGE